MACRAWLSPALSMTWIKEETMLVQPVVVPGSGMLSWTVLGDDDVPVVPVEGFLAYLTDIGRSPNTVKAYAHDLKDFWDFTGLRGLDWREVRLEDVGEFVAWLQLPLAGRCGAVAVLPSAAARVGAATVNRKLAAVSAFYAHQARHGAEAGDLLAVWKTGGRGGWKPFLHHVSKGKPYRGRVISLKAPVKLPRVLAVAEMQAILDACTRLRDRFFFAVLHETGCRAGEALGLRHEDIAAAEREISIGVGCGEIRVTVAVEISGGDAVGGGLGGVVHGGLEAAVAVAHQDGVVVRDNIQMAVAIEVGHRNLIVDSACGRVGSRLRQRGGGRGVDGHRDGLRRARGKAGVAFKTRLQRAPAGIEQNGGERRGAIGRGHNSQNDALVVKSDFAGRLRRIDGGRQRDSLSKKHRIGADYKRYCC